jgi:hypothetical protein
VLVTAFLPSVAKFDARNPVVRIECGVVVLGGFIPTGMIVTAERRVSVARLKVGHLRKSGAYRGGQRRRRIDTRFTR